MRIISQLAELRRPLGEKYSVIQGPEEKPPCLQSRHWRDVHPSYVLARASFYPPKLFLLAPTTLCGKSLRGLWNGDIPPVLAGNRPFRALARIVSRFRSTNREMIQK